MAAQFCRVRRRITAWLAEGPGRPPAAINPVASASLTSDHRRDRHIWPELKAVTEPPAPAQCRAKRGAQARPGLTLPLSKERRGPAAGMAALARHMHCPPLLLTSQILSSATPTPRHGGAAHSLAVRPCWAGGQSLRTGKDGKCERPIRLSPCPWLVSPGLGLSSKWQQLKRRRGRARTGM